MIVCEKCFSDRELKSIIINRNTKGVCPVCGQKDVFIYDTDADDTLTMSLEGLLDIYSPISSVSDDFPKAETYMLKAELIKNWNIFSTDKESDVYNILTGVCKNRYKEMPELFDQPVCIQEMHDYGYLSEHSLLTTNSWEDFVEALETKNRYHTHFLKLDLLERFCSYIRKPYKRGDIKYRCRISNEDGLPADKMGAPSVELTGDGRANARGVRCLYLGDSPETTIYETRAGAYDYATVGIFDLQKDIIVVDLKMINQMSPFVEGMDVLEYAVNREHLNKINNEMSKAMRRSDSTLDYVPTQYITDFVKSICDDEGNSVYSGIEYKSVMNKEGYNLAIFDPELYECKATTVYRIDNIRYEKHKL